MNKWAKAWVTELKVKTMTSATLGMGVVLAILNDTQTNNDLLWGPPIAQGLEAALVPTLINYVTGWITKHTPRPDLGVPAVQQVAVKDGTKGA